MLGDANLGGELWALFTSPQVSCKSFARASLSCLASVCGWVPCLKFLCPLLTVNLLFCLKWIKLWVDWCSVNFWAQIVYGQVPFVLVESEAHRHPRQRGEAVFVHVNMDGSQHSLPLVTVFYQLHPVPASSYTFLQAMFGRRYPVCNCLLTIAYTNIVHSSLLGPFSGYSASNDNPCFPAGWPFGWRKNTSTWQRDNSSWCCEHVFRWKPSD